MSNDPVSNASAAVFRNTTGAISQATWKGWPLLKEKGLSEETDEDQVSGNSRLWGRSGALLQVPRMQGILPHGRKSAAFTLAGARGWGIAARLQCRHRLSFPAVTRIDDCCFQNWYLRLFLRHCKSQTRRFFTTLKKKWKKSFPRLSFGTTNGIGKEGAVKGARGGRPKNDCVEVHKKKEVALSVERLHEF